ncbi:hypothetical protein PAEPH01_0387 [Pancytospora epiphaga]|nr:hypothetical protein PAEPH01_0387 [Pancytospora epiphaga]
MTNSHVESAIMPSNRHKEVRAAPKSILLDSPSTSSSHVSFDTNLKILEISFNNGMPNKYKAKQFQIRDKTLILSTQLKDLVKRKANKYSAMLTEDSNIILKYKRRADIDTDLRALGLQSKNYIENKIIVQGLGYRETEESVQNYFSNFGDVEKVILEKNSKSFCTGKGTITFRSNINTGQQFRLGNRPLRIERIKKQMMNTTRLHISHMSKDINISKLRAILKTAGFIPKNIRIDMVNGKNRGYGFVEFNKPEEAECFMEGFERVKRALGEGSHVEFSKEKKLK